MKLLHKILFIFFCCSPQFFVQAQTTIRLQGTVVDASTGRLMPFVYVVINQGITGGNTDLNGKFNFEVKIPIEKITFTHVGYEDFVYEVRTPEDLQPLQRPLKIPLLPKSNELPEAVLTSENPAHRLIKKAFENRNLHNPKKLPYYTYNSYNKFIIDAEAPNKTSPAGKDSSDYELALFLQNNHLFLAETVTNYQYRAPTYQHEKVIANRVSGFKNPQFIALSTQGQLLNFYEDYFNLLNRKYLNPISEQSWKKYAFSIEDTVLVKPDTLFWISFEPLPNKYFDGLKGRLAIHTRTFAIQSMDIMSALPETETSLGFHLEQQNEWVQNMYWFPKQLRTILILKDSKVGDKPMTAQWQTHLSDLDFKTKPKMRDFLDTSLEILPNAHLQSKEFWASYRPDTLSKKELNTYINVDSIGTKAKLDRMLAFSQYLTFARIPIKNWKVDLDIKQLLVFNRYESVRLGAGFITNDLFSKKYALGTYLAYGTRDGNFKYGFSAQYRPFETIDASLSARYSSDIRESGQVRFLAEDTGINFNSYRNLLASRMDKVRLFELKMQGRPLQNVRLGAILRTQRVLPTYDYTFILPQNTREPATYTKRYQISELNFQFQYFWGAQFMRFGSMRSLVATQLPSLQASYTQGIRAFGSDFRYGKWEFKLAHEHTFRNFGTTRGEVWLGFSKGDLPYQSLWNGQGGNLKSYIMVASCFQTMDLYEFMLDRFVFVFVQHNFRGLLYKSPYKWFQPELVLHQNFGWGDLKNPDSHQGIASTSLKKGYWESGVIINNLYKFKYVGALRMGLGGGVFLRYGYYKRSEMQDNISYKLSMRIDI